MNTGITSTEVKLTRSPGRVCVFHNEHLLILLSSEQKKKSPISVSFSLSRSRFSHLHLNIATQASWWKHAAATYSDSKLLTTYTPSVMFYKHILNNSAHPHLPNGLCFPPGA